MAISEPNIKRLWGRSAGRCAFPGCGKDCLEFIVANSPVVIGEMAHVIAKKPNGPRGRPESGEDTYENLVLMCPTHHRLIDKAPEGIYPEELLFEWKEIHETRVSELLESPAFTDRVELNKFARKILIENHTCWETYGPEGEIAKENPNSGAGEIWPFRKLSLLIPNNRIMMSVIKENSDLFTKKEYKVCCKFIEHAEGFEASSINPIEGVPRFPEGFEEIFDD